MTTVHFRRTLPTISVLAAGALALTGCGGSGSMMGDGGSAMGGTGQGMSDGGSAMGRTGQGMNGYTLSGSTCTPAAPSSSGAVVHVILADMGMTQMMGGTAPMGARMMLRATPSTVAAGTITLQASDRGWRTHELVVLPLAAGAKIGQRIPGANGKVSETGSLGEASTACAAGAGEGIPAGSASWVTLKLPAGRYELVCNLPNHYADGMRQELDVT
ncbi:hypothetical protein V3G39_13145 [Dermatophilaceae bacterium Sec6.4]